MLQNDRKAYIYGFLMILKKLFEIFHRQKMGEGAKESLARYTAKKSKRNIKNCGLHTQPSAKILLLGV